MDFRRVKPECSQSEPGSNGYEGVHYISQSSRIGALPSDDLMPYLGHTSRVSYPITEMQSAYSTAPADWAEKTTFLLFKKVSQKKVKNWFLDCHV